MSTNSTGADRVAVCAGMWRPIEMSDGDIIKLFQSGKHGERNYRQFDGEWYVLDESPEAIAECQKGNVDVTKLVQKALEDQFIYGDNVLDLTLKLQQAIADNERLKREMKRHLPILERIMDMPELWESITGGTGIATLNGYRAAIEGGKNDK